MTSAASSKETTPVAAAELFSTEQYTGGFRRIVVLLLSLVIAPTALLLAVGILMLVFYEARLNIVFGILVVLLVLMLAVGSVIAMVFLRREAKVSQLQSDFVSKVSHELRTPLTSIRMFAETLQRPDLPPARAASCLEALSSETARLTERIERLLDWGRMEAGRRVYQLSADEVPVVLETAVDAFESVMMGQRALVRLEMNEDLPPIRVDREAIVDALLNLLTNAHKYSSSSREILLSASAGQRWVRISVEDQGVGIPRSEHRRIFQKFYRVDERLSRAVEGSGLGLAMVQHIAQGHGGRVELVSEPNKGSTFTLVLPRAEVADEADEAGGAGGAVETRDSGRAASHV